MCASVRRCWAPAFCLPSCIQVGLLAAAVCCASELKAAGLQHGRRLWHQPFFGPLLRSIKSIMIKTHYITTMIWLQGRLSAAEGRAAELEGQLGLLTGAQQQLGARLAALERDANAAAAAVKEVRPGRCCYECVG
jgi:hypothetical protein